MQIQYTDKINANDGIKMVLYGPSGVGKTVALKTAPRPFIFNAEKGLLSLRKFKIPYVTISTFKELVEAYQWAFKSSEAKNYDTFCLDSLSEIAEVIAVEERKKNPDARKWSPAKDDQVYTIVRDFRDMKQKHVVCIAKQIIIETGTPPVLTKCAMPVMPGDKLQNNLPYFWDIVARMSTLDWESKTYRVLHTNSDPSWVAKDRSDNLAPIEIADLGAIFKKAIL